MRAADFFSAQDQERIAEAIQEVEKKTSGEVAVMVVAESDSYPESHILAGILFGGLAALVITDYWLNDSLSFFILLALLLSVLAGWLVSYLPSIRRFFIPGARLENMVREQAVQSFYAEGLYKTRDATGVLFFLSLFEHRVWVLADKGIYEKISPETLQEYAADIARSVKTGKAAETLCLSIRQVGSILSTHFPIKADDENELDDKVIIG